MELRQHNRFLRMSLLLGTILFFLPFPSPNTAAGKIFGYQDSDGHWHFPTGGNGQRSPVQTKSARMSGEEFIQAYQEVIRSAAAAYGVDQRLVKAVIKAESDFDHHAVSRKGAAGLMQLMPGTAEEMKVGNPYNPKENIVGGTRYLGSLLRRFHDDTALAVAAFNAGPGKVEACGGVPPIEETRNFVEKVLYYYGLFRKRNE
jgi:soluble lytic murein transglycosylase-like protein